jgi:DNA invertase Pin-like site-specific DNA recombinase
VSAERELVVWKLDRPGGSQTHLVETIQTFSKRGVGCRSLPEQLDTTTLGGSLIVPIFASLAEFEREQILEGH